MHAADKTAMRARQVGQQQVIAFQNALAQVQRPCGDGRISKTSTKKKANSNSGKRLLLQNNRNDDSQNSNDAVGAVIVNASSLPGVSLRKVLRIAAAMCNGVHGNTHL